MIYEKSSGYSVYSNFDIEKHKKAFTDYLEVIILPTGKVVYAVPSHVEKLIAIAMEKHKCNKKNIVDMCPREYYFDFITWLCKITNCVSVWNNFYTCNQLNKRQLAKLIRLKEEGLYQGEIRDNVG